VFGNVILPLLILATPFLGDAGEDSSAICGAASKEAVFARSLSKSQLETLYAESMELLASSDLAGTYENGQHIYPPIPHQFAYLKPLRIKTLSYGAYSYVSFTLKGCLDEFIHLRVEKAKIVLSYSTGGASSRGQEVLWTPHK
jgi:hypothetical protein